jgi:hypothetical protein
MSVLIYHDEMEDRVIPGSSSFKVGGPSPSDMSGDTYSVHGVWFPRRLPLEGIDRIKIMSHNR